MKSINDATWKDAAIIEARSLQARIEGLCGWSLAHPEGRITQGELEAIGRQASRLAVTIEHIQEVTRKPRPTRQRKAVLA